MINQQSLEYLNVNLKKQGKNTLEMNQFRPNVVVVNGDPHCEDQFGKFYINQCEFETVKLTDRCSVTQTN